MSGGKQPCGRAGRGFGCAVRSTVAFFCHCSAQAALEKRENAVLRQLRMYLRNVLHRLQREVKYRVFATSGALLGEEGQG